MEMLSWSQEKNKKGTIPGQKIGEHIPISVLKGLYFFQLFYRVSFTDNPIHPLKIHSF